MFFNKQIKIKKDMIPNIRPTSKASLKQSCLYMANGNLEKAEKIYDYMIKDMEDLPMFDIPEPTRVQQVKQGINDTMKWVKENQEEIFVWVDIIQGFFNNNKKKGGGGGSVPPASSVAIPPIN